MNQWTSPDAYAGDVHDPMSQHPYMWNDNNPVQYSDPSGYCAGVLSCVISIGGQAAGRVAGGAAVAAAGTIGALAVAVGGLVLATTGETAKEPEAPVAGAELEEVKGTGTQIWGKPGDANTAEGDFDKKELSNVRTYGNGTKVGEAGDGSKVNVHKDTDPNSNATLEIQKKDGTIVKVRYRTPEKPPSSSSSSQGNTQ